MQQICAVRREGSGAGQITAVRIERDLIGLAERTNEIADSVLGEDEAAIHVVTCIEEHENIGAADQRIESCRGSDLLITEHRLSGYGASSSPFSPTWRAGASPSEKVAGFS